LPSNTKLVLAFNHHHYLMEYHFDASRFTFSPSDYPAVSPVPQNLTNLNDVRAGLAFARTEVARYDVEMSALADVQSFLAKNRSLITQYIQETAALTSPIRELPVEVLSHIFLLAINNRCSTIETSDLLDRQPFILAAVCRSWSELMASSPLLWSMVRLNFWV
jgi:hypothetical protein